MDLSKPYNDRMDELSDALAKDSWTNPERIESSQMVLAQDMSDCPELGSNGMPDTSRVNFGSFWVMHDHNEPESTEECMQDAYHESLMAELKSMGMAVAA